MALHIQIWFLIAMASTVGATTTETVTTELGAESADPRTEESYNNVDGDAFEEGIMGKSLPEDEEKAAGTGKTPSSAPKTTTAAFSTDVGTSPEVETSTVEAPPSTSPPRKKFEVSSTGVGDFTSTVATTAVAPPEDRTMNKPTLPPDDAITSVHEKPFSTRESASCDFGLYPNATLCEWHNGQNVSLIWQAGTGNGANWLGGPFKDFNHKSPDGGYVFVETSQMADKTDPKFTNQGASLEGPMLGSTGAKGTCFSFAYSIRGLSPAGFKVLLQEVDFTDNSIKSSFRSRDSGDMMLWQAQYHSQGAWQEASLLYTHHKPHRLVLVGESAEANNPARRYRGYIAVDMLTLRLGGDCQGFCTFAAGFCDWTNEEGDEFDWSLSRGSSNPVTGPTMDSSSSGSYAFIDSDYPRRPGDVARLVSSNFPATGPDSPLCMRFWFHMFGPAVGSLRVLVRRPQHDAFFPQQLWSLSGSAGNAWFMGQVTVSSLQDYQIVFEASVGNTAMGDIAIDDITLSHGPCPVSPQVAGQLSGDCSFEVDECGWIDSGTKDTVHWERLPVRTQKPRNRRPPLLDSHAANSVNEYFLGVGRRNSPHMKGHARLTSRTFTGSMEPKCMTFWYLMTEPFIDVSGSSLGAVKVFLKADKDSPRPALTPIWQLYNNQYITWKFAQIPIKEASNYSIVFEGSWGPNRASGSIAIDDIAFYTGDCSIRPAEARVRIEDCSFESGLCGWHNWTRGRAEAPGGQVAWQQAMDTHRPARLRDNTFGTTDGYIFFDIFTTNQKESAVMLTSSSIKMRDNIEDICFTFWYAAFGAMESTHLLVLKTRILDEPDNAGRELLWQLTPEKVDTSRPVWASGQVSVDARSPFKLVIEGRASNGGFAVDDIRLLPGTCKIRPAEAKPK